MSWEVEYRSSVEKDVSRLPDHIRQEALQTIAGLRSEAFPQGCKKLKGTRRQFGAGSRYRVRIARDYRLVYSVFKDSRLIQIEFVGHRKDAYRWF